MATTCPKCQHANPDTARFCMRCHMTLRFTCPACRSVQMHGGKCDQCGVDFAKYAAVLQFQMQGEAQRQREHAKSRHAMMKQALLLPVTGGWSLLKHVKSVLHPEG